MARLPVTKLGGISLYADGSMTSDQAGWDFTVERGTTNIHESSAVYEVKTSSLTMEAIIVVDILHWITPRYFSQTNASVLSNSVKVKMENSKIACNNVFTAIFKDLWNANSGHGRLNRIDGIDK